jgi:hypothetical protein
VKATFRYENLTTGPFTAGTAVVKRGDDGPYVCRACGHEWYAGERRLWWPISFAWRRRAALHFFDRHGVHVGYDAIERPRVAQVFHVGALKIRFGFTRAGAKGGRP